MQNPNGLSKNIIYGSKIAAKNTIDKYLDRMAQSGLIIVEEPMKKGLGKKCRFSKLGFDLYSQRALSPAAGIGVNLELSKNYWQWLEQYRGKEETLAIKDHFSKAMKDPLIEHELANITSFFMQTYVESFLGKTAIYGRLLNDKRFFLVATVPKEFGMMIEQLIEKKRITDYLHATKIMMDTGLTAITTIFNNEEKATEFILVTRCLKIKDGVISGIETQEEKKKCKEILKNMITSSTV